MNYYVLTGSTLGRWEYSNGVATNFYVGEFSITEIENRIAALGVEK
jgi:hypothetical protein